MPDLRVIANDSRLFMWNLHPLAYPPSQLQAPHHPPPPWYSRYFSAVWVEIGLGNVLKLYFARVYHQQYVLCLSVTLIVSVFEAI